MKEFGFQWHITNFCNLRCRHCYQDDFTEREDLETGTCKKIVDLIARALPGVDIVINVTGGEPLLRDDIFDILNHLEDIENVKEYSIITNAIPLDGRTNARLNRLTKLNQVKVSLECSDAAVNDSIRGRGSFKRITENFARIDQKKKVLMYTLGSYNCKNAPAMLALGETLGADAVILERFVPQGRARALRDQYLKPDEWLAVVQSVVEFSRLDSRPADLLAFRAFYVEMKNREVRGALCNLGEESMALMPNADIYPCRRTPVKIGNLLADDFSDILIRLRLLRESFSKNLKGRCTGCPVLGCSGCRALAYALTGDLYEEDRQCYRSNFL